MVPHNETDDNARGEPQIDFLLRALKDADLQVRVQAAWALGDARSSPRTIAGLIAGFADEEGYVCAVISDALNKIGRPAVPALVEALENGDGWVRSWAAITLGTMKEPAREAVPPLTRALTDNDIRVRVEVAGALVKLDADHPTIIAVLTEALQCTDAQARKRASYHFTCLGAKARSALPALLSALRDDERTVRENAAEAIELIAAADEHAGGD